MFQPYDMNVAERKSDSGFLCSGTTDHFHLCSRCTADTTCQKEVFDLESDRISKFVVDKILDDLMMKREMILDISGGKNPQQVRRPPRLRPQT